MYIVTFNLRGSWAGDGINAFRHRAGEILDKIDQEAPDIMAFQEVSPHIRQYLERHLPEYNFVGHGRNADLGGEALAIAVRKSTTVLLSSSVFWLSPTPKVPGSRFADQSECPRIVVSALLADKQSGLKLYVYNVHLDHIGEGARVAGIKQLMEQIDSDRQFLKAPTFVLGDFNADPDSATIRYCKSLGFADLAPAGEATFHNFGRGDGDDGRFVKIDYIFADAAARQYKSEGFLWTDCSDGIYLSDHYPVAAKVDLTKQGRMSS
ncbi:endonuclease/exonuclease/phosphatase family protein [Paenibacillus cymbidii]|uniref:endonuclease/exonuclease/phosphatase family protein n=1 Tax=Paenibacillus cymbidii TaxID=1639034 RepID=UPI001080F52C|nr:endonuclease/exonuclease/phosphatase family protein [Paenibacillus cymbidii]